TFAPGESSKNIRAKESRETINEADETFFVNLSNAANASITKAQGVGTIRNDDAKPSLSISDASVLEGNSGTVDAVFTVTLAGASIQPVTVTFATADGTAIAPSDYVAASGTLTFAHGESSKNIVVKVNGDTLNEADETFFVNLSNAANASITKSQGLGTIRNDDAKPSLSISDASVLEGNSGTVDAVFTVTLAGASSQPITVNFATADGTAVAPSDYVAASGTLTFAPGESSKTILVKVNGDTVNEAYAYSTLIRSNAANASITKAQGVGTIRNDDAKPSLSISD